MTKHEIFIQWTKIVLAVSYGTAIVGLLIKIAYG